MKVFGYESKRPHLRVVEIPQGEVTPSPVSVNRAIAAFDDACRREGWVALHAHQEVWGVPVPLSGKAFFVGNSFRFFPGPSDRTLWLQDEESFRDPGVSSYVEYDGVARAVVNRVAFPRDADLKAVTEVGFILWGTDGIELWDWDATRLETITSAKHVIAAHKNLLAVLRDRQLELIDVATQRCLPIDKPTGGDWHLFRGKFSPDGQRFAHAVTIKPRPTDEDPLALLKAYMAAVRSGQKPPTPEPDISQLVITDCASGETRVLDTPFYGPACMPVWALDGRQIIIQDGSRRPTQWWLIDPDLLTVEFLKSQKRPPTPLLDITDLAPQ